MDGLIDRYVCTWVDNYSLHERDSVTQYRCGEEIRDTEKGERTGIVPTVGRYQGIRRDYAEDYLMIGTRLSIDMQMHCLLIYKYDALTGGAKHIANDSNSSHGLFCV